MDIKEAIKERHSVRQFQDIPVTEVDREQLNELIKACNTESGLHMQLILNDPDCFNTFLAHYGKFTNANNYIAMVGKKSFGDLDERCGYFGQKIVLEAQRMGLNTCWVAGTYGKGKCKAAMMAPTALNQQKFMIDLKGDLAVITAKAGPMTKIDLGIVKYNFEAASGRKCG